MPDAPVPDAPASHSPASQRFNVVVLPVTPFPADDARPVQRFQLSAGRRDRALRMVSPSWSEGEVRSALASLGLPRLQVEELLRGNTMAFGPRTLRRIHFSTAQLEAIGLVPFEPAAEIEALTV